MSNKFYFYADKNCFALRLFGWGVQLKNTKPLFSERNGYVKTYWLPFGWRSRFLKRVKK